MIDKSIRQHYQTGKEVGPFKKGKDIIMSALPQVKKITPTSIAKGAIQRDITKKLAGTGLLSSLGPIGTLLAMFLSRKGMDFASKKWGEGGVKQAYQAGMTGFGSPAEGRELRQLEKRRDYMLHRRDVLGKKISEKNLEEVTNRINTIKKTAPVTVTDYEGEAYGTPDTIANIRAQEKAEAEIAMQKTIREAEQQQREKAEFDRVVAENKAKAEAEAAAQRAYAARVPDPIYQPQGGGGGGRGGQTSQAAADRAGGSSYSSPFKYGGPVYVYKRNNSIDKALKGRKRDI